MYSKVTIQKLWSPIKMWICWNCTTKRYDLVFYSVLLIYWHYRHFMFKCCLFQTFCILLPCLDLDGFFTLYWVMWLSSGVDFRFYDIIPVSHKVLHVQLILTKFKINIRTVILWLLVYFVRYKNTNVIWLHVKVPKETSPACAAYTVYCLSLLWVHCFFLIFSWYTSVLYCSPYRSTCWSRQLCSLLQLFYCHGNNLQWRSASYSQSETNGVSLPWPVWPCDEDVY